MDEKAKIHKEVKANIFKWAGEQNEPAFLLEWKARLETYTDTQTRFCAHTNLVKLEAQLTSASPGSATLLKDAQRARCKGRGILPQILSSAQTLNSDF